MSEVVTGDAVVLDVRVAQLPVRAVGALIDIAVIVIGYLLALMLWAATLSQFDDAVTAAIMIIFTVLVFVGYPLVFETATRGRTVGKIVMGLRVVSDDGGPERFPGPVSGTGARRDLDVVGKPGGDLQHAFAESQTDRRYLRGHGSDQRTRAEVGAAAHNAAIAGLVGRVAAAVRAGRRAS